MVVQCGDAVTGDCPCDEMADVGNDKLGVQALQDEQEIEVDGNKSKQTGGIVSTRCMSCLHNKARCSGEVAHGVSVAGEDDSGELSRSAVASEGATKDGSSTRVVTSFLVLMVIILF